MKERSKSSQNRAQIRGVSKIKRRNSHEPVYVPIIVEFVGAPGSGKTTLATKTAQHVDAYYYKVPNHGRWSERLAEWIELPRILWFAVRHYTLVRAVVRAAKKRHRLHSLKTIVHRTYRLEQLIRRAKQEQRPVLYCESSIKNLLQLVSQDKLNLTEVLTELQSTYKNVHLAIVQVHAPVETVVQRRKARGLKGDSFKSDTLEAFTKRFQAMEDKTIARFSSNSIQSDSSDSSAREVARFIERLRTRSSLVEIVAYKSINTDSATANSASHQGGKP